QFAAMQSLAPSLGVELKSLPLRDVGEIDRILAAFARGSNLGLIATRIGAAISQRDLIIALAARHRLPAVYPLRFFVTGGGLVSYGPDIVDQYRRAAVYVDRILKGERQLDAQVAADLPTRLLQALQQRGDPSMADRLIRAKRQQHILAPAPAAARAPRAAT